MIGHITADTLTKMFSLIQKDSFFEEPLHKYFFNKDDRNEFRQFLHLAICENPKSLSFWNAGIFKWIYLTMIKNNVCSSSSPYHYKYRNIKYSLYDDIPGFQLEDLDLIDDEIDLIEIQQIKQQKIDKIKSIIQEQTKKNPILTRDFQLFNKYYIEKKTYREISLETKIPLMSVHIYVKNAKELIQSQITGSNTQSNSAKK